MFILHQLLSWPKESEIEVIIRKQKEYKQQTEKQKKDKKREDENIKKQEELE